MHPKIVAQVSLASLCAMIGGHRNRRRRNETRPRYPEGLVSEADNN